MPAGGYHWHYLDALSDDGSAAVVVIALIGNPFSPGYARARARGPASALDFCAMNVAIYARGASAWALQERQLSPRDRATSSVTIGSSHMRWDGDRLEVEIDEHRAPVGGRIRGRIELRPVAYTGVTIPIGDENSHHWWPVAPVARVDVHFQSPDLRFSGSGYHDANAGAAPLDTAFDTWHWSRAHDDRGALLTYDVACASGAKRSVAFRVSPRGEIDDLEDVWATALPRTFWGLDRRARVDAGRAGRVIRSLEDGPFYARALLETELGGRPVVAMHETLAAHRLRRRLVRTLAAFRMRHF